MNYLIWISRFWLVSALIFGVMDGVRAWDAYVNASYLSCFFALFCVGFWSWVAVKEFEELGELCSRKKGL